ncbi:MAG: Holliday junction resolvase RuvX [Candidatus Geothermincolia bacterium]
MRSRKLALDIGERRTGVAISDPLGMLAHPLEIIDGSDGRGLAERVRELVGEYGADALVIGLPVSQSGEEGAQARRVRELAEPLRALGVPLIFWDERLSSVEATRRMREAGIKVGKGRTADAAAAALILQGYLEAASGGRDEEGGRGR